MTTSILLEQAVADAKALKEAALKRAEATVVEKYSEQIKEAVNSILQDDEEESLSPDDLAAGLDAEPSSTDSASADLEEPSQEPDGAEDVFSTGDEAPSEEDADEAAPENKLTDQVPSAMSLSDEEVEIDLDQLSDLVDKELAGIEAEIGDDSDQIQDTVSQLADTVSDLKDTVEDLKASQQVDDEELDPDAQNSMDDNEPIMDKKYGSLTEEADTPEEDSSDGAALDLEQALQDYLSTQAAEEETASSNISADLGDEEPEPHQYARNVMGKEDDQSRREALQALRGHNKKLKEQLKTQKAELLKYKNAMKHIMEKTERVNLQNAILLYEKCALTSDSLNERQKTMIVEAVSKATSIREAKVIFETSLNATAGSKRQPEGPKSLREVNERHTVKMIRGAERKEKDSYEDVLYRQRMKQLAGI